jgi:flagellar biosynthesis protein FlhF
MVGQVLQRQVTTNGVTSPTMPKHLFDMYLQLIAQDISNELADQICSAVRQELNEGQLADADNVRCAVQRHLAAFIPVAGESIVLESGDGRPLTIALIGPTGVGKTTTLAKLAATFKLRYGKSVGLITADTYRIAAVDQLRTYAEIINLPLHVALTPAEMKRAVSMLSDRDVILIDTAGRSQKDVNRIAELKRFITAANPHEVHLVLSGTAGEKVLLQEAGAFSAVGVHKIVLTKLDEAVSFGMLVSTIRTIGKQLSFVTTGQEVPDDIEVGRADRLAQLVLGAAPKSTSPAPVIESVKESSRVPSVRPPTSECVSLAHATAAVC